MDKLTYEHRVQQSAEKITKEIHPTAYNDRLLSMQDGNYWIVKVDGYKDVAKLCIADQAEAIRDFAAIYSNHIMSDTEQFLVDNGYIKNL